MTCEDMLFAIAMELCSIAAVCIRAGRRPAQSFCVLVLNH
jgi:hypothetical protein